MLKTVMIRGTVTTARAIAQPKIQRSPFSASVAPRQNSKKDFPGFPHATSQGPHSIRAPQLDSRAPAQSSSFSSSAVSGQGHNSGDPSDDLFFTPPKSQSKDQRSTDPGSDMSDLFYTSPRAREGTSTDPGRAPIPAFSNGFPQHSDWSRLAGFGEQAAFRSEKDDAADQEKTWETRRVWGPPCATPSSGRTVNVTDGDLASAFTRLKMIVNQNNIYKEIKAGSRFEKPNEKRNRLKREHRRALFADMIRKKVQLIMKLKSRDS